MVFNHAEDNLRAVELIKAVQSESGARLLAAFGQFLKYPDNMSFVLPFPIEGKTYTVGQGLERATLYIAIVEELGRRLDHAQ